MVTPLNNPQHGAFCLPTKPHNTFCLSLDPSQKNVVVAMVGLLCTTPSSFLTNRPSTSDMPDSGEQARPDQLSCPALLRATYCASAWPVGHAAMSGTLWKGLETRFYACHATKRLRGVTKRGATHKAARDDNHAVLQGVPFTGVQVLRQKRLILLHEQRARDEVKLPPPLCAAHWSTPCDKTHLFPTIAGEWFRF